MKKKKHSTNIDKMFRPNYKVINDNPENCKTLAYGNNSGVYHPLAVDSQGNVLSKLADSSGQAFSLPLTAFGEVRVAALTPMTGWNFNYNVNTDLLNTTGNVSVTNGKAQISAAAGNSSTLETIAALRYSPGTGALARFTAIFAVPGNTGSKELIGIGDRNDGFFFGYNAQNPVSFGILRRRGGSDVEWITQASWNGDKFNGTGASGVMLDPVKGNVYSIRYQGFGAITFNIENPSTGEAIIVHRISYANVSTVPSILNPTLPLHAEVVSVGETLTLQTASAMAFVEGESNQVIITRNSIAASKASITTENNILTIKNKTDYAGGVNNNRVRVKVDYLSTAANGNNPASIRMIKNPTVYGSPSFSDIGINSVIQYDTAGTTVSGGRTYMTYQLAKQESNQLFIDNMDIELAPGDKLTITGTSTNTTTLQVTLSWKELW